MNPYRYINRAQTMHKLTGNKPPNKRLTLTVGCRCIVYIKKLSL